MIHSTAVIDPDAQLDSSVCVGPYAVIDANVRIGPDCRLGPHVYITGHTTIGANNRFHAGCVIGDAPQDVKYKDAPTRVAIGDNNLFREGVTVHRSATADEATVVGSNNFLMVNSHIGHNARVGDNVIFANGALVGGHAQVFDRAFFSGNSMLHQFARIGELALLQGGAGASQDVPPFTMVRGINGICGLNIVGLRRAGASPAERLELKRLYNKLFMSGQNLSQAILEAKSEFQSEHSRIMLEFIAASKRGVCRHRGRAGID